MKYIAPVAELVSFETVSVILTSTCPAKNPNEGSGTGWGDDDEE